MVYKTLQDKIVFNVSDGLANYSQRNNVYIWKKNDLTVYSANTCNVTSVVMAASYVGAHAPNTPHPDLNQPEDRFAAFCLESSDVSNVYRNKMPALWQEWQDGRKDALPPNQVHEILAYAANLWYGYSILKFRVDLPITELIRQVTIEGCPVVMSGTVPKDSKKTGTLNHVVVLVGAIFNAKSILTGKEVDAEKIKNVTPESLIFDDPWGNFIDGYDKSTNGNDVVCPYDLFLKYFKPIGDNRVKWGHLVKPGAPRA